MKTEWEVFLNKKMTKKLESLIPRLKFKSITLTEDHRMVLDYKFNKKPHNMKIPMHLWAPLDLNELTDFLIGHIEHFENLYN